MHTSNMFLALKDFLPPLDISESYQCWLAVRRQMLLGSYCLKRYATVDPYRGFFSVQFVKDRERFLPEAQRSGTMSPVRGYTRNLRYQRGP